jgi:hypothetical protein
VLPTLIYQRLAGFGPAVLSEVAVLSVLIAMIAVLGIVVQDVMLSRRDFRTVRRPPKRARSSSGAGGARVEIALWAIAFLALLLPLTALLMTALVPAVGVPLTPASATLDNFRFVLFEHAAARRAFRNSFGLSAAGGLAIVLIAVPLAYFVVWRRSRLLRAHQRGDGSAVCGPGRRAGDCRHPPVPEAAAASRRLAVQHRLDHLLLLSRALPRARLAAGGERLSSARSHARRRRRRSSARGSFAASPPSSCRSLRPPPRQARCSSS